MIQINLLPGPKKRSVGFSMPKFGDLVTSVKDPMLMGAGAAVAVSALFIGGTWFQQKQHMNNLRPTVQDLRVEHRNYRTLIGEKRRMELLRDSLLTQLEAIREIDQDRYVWPHILEEVTRAVPDFTWLVNLDFIPSTVPIDPITGVAAENARPPVRFSIEGRTSDIQAYTRFFRQLGQSPWFTDMRLGATQTVQEQERPITSFQIEGTYRVADSAFIRTIPVTESIR